MNPASRMESGDHFSKPDDAPLIGVFSYLRMALRASYGLDALHLSSSCLKDWTSAAGWRAFSCNDTIEIVGVAAAG